MPVVNLDTTNVLLGIMAGVSVLQAIVTIVVVVWAYRTYRRTIETVHRLENDQIRPLVARVETLMTKMDDVVVDVKNITSTVTRRTEQAAAVMSRPVTRAVGIARGVAVALNTLFNHRQEHETWPRSASASGPGAERSEHYGG